MSQDAEKYTPKRGDPCRKCGTTFVVKPNMFFLTGIGTFSGSARRSRSGLEAAP